jgi:hypothetical protein
MATAVRRKPETKGGLFRLLIGDHVGWGPPGCECDDCLKTPEAERRANGNRGKDHRYRARFYHPQKGRFENPDTGAEIKEPGDYDNDVIDSPTDLEKHNGPHPSLRKFARVGSDHDREWAGGPPVAQAPEPYPLEKMTYAQLLAVADDEEVALEGAKGKEEVLRKIQEQRAQK